MDIKLLPQKETAPVEDDGVPKAWGETYADYMVGF